MQNLSSEAFNKQSPLKEAKQWWEDCKKVVQKLNQPKVEAVSRGLVPQQQLADISSVPHGCLVSLEGTAMAQVVKGHRS